MAEKKSKEETRNEENGYYKVNLVKLIDVAQKYIKGEIDDKGLDELIDQLYIRLYIPIQEKTSLAMAILTQHLYTATDIQEIRVAELYRNMFFYVLLGAYGGVDCSNIQLINYENYDLLYPIFAPFLLSLCEDDYNVVKEMINDSLNLYNIQGFTETLNNVDMDSVKNETEQIKKMVSSLEENKQVIADLKDIAALNDPDTHEILQRLRLQAEKEKENLKNKFN